MLKRNNKFCTRFNSVIKIEGKLVAYSKKYTAAQAVVAEIVASGGKAVVNTSNITNYDDSLNAVKQALESFGDLHAVVKNAGINRDRMFASMTEEDWDRIHRVNAKGVFFCLQRAARQMIAVDGGQHLVWKSADILGVE